MNIGDYYRMVKNWFLILVGYHLVNREGYTVWYDKGQKWSNIKRKRPYRLHNKTWRRLK